LKPGVLIRGMIDDQIGNQAYSALMCLVEQLFEVIECAVIRMDGVVVGDILTVVLQR